MLEHGARAEASLDILMVREKDIGKTQGRHQTDGSQRTVVKTRQPFERPASEHQINSTGPNIEYRIKPNQSLDIGLSPNQIKASWGGTNETTSRSHHAVDALPKCQPTLAPASSAPVATTATSPNSTS